MAALLVFQQFENIIDAERVASILEDAGIQTSVEKPNALLDSNFIGTNYEPTVNLKINGDDFKAAREILIEKAEVNLDEVDKDYMLLSFSEEELMDVIAKPDEWGFYNYNIASALLKKKGVMVSAEQKEVFEKERMAELRKQKSMGMFWIVVAFAIPIVNVIYAAISYDTYIASNVIWLVPGAVGLAIGFILLYSKRTIPDGTRIPVYVDKDRKYASMILKVNALVWIANGVIFAIYNAFLKM